LVIYFRAQPAGSQKFSATLRFPVGR